MLFVDGEGFASRADYELALEDKKVIDEIKLRYDLKNRSDVEKLYREIRNYRFKTKVGDNFDDYIYELYQKIKDGTFEEAGAAAPASGKKAGKPILKAGKPSRSGSAAAKPRRGKVKTGRSEAEPISNEVLKEIKKQNRIRNAVVVVLLLIAFGSLGYFAIYYHNAHLVDETSETLSSLKEMDWAEVISVKPVISRNYAPDVVIPDILDEYKALYTKNKSMVGWLTIDDTVIDYPVMQTEDNEYYLKHNFDLKEDKNGCIFLDAACDIILGNTNFILYGHHMKSGKMFASLIKYANEEYYQKHKIVKFDTIYEKGTYEVMYAFRSRVYSSDQVAFKYYQFIDANSPEEFDSYMEEMAEISLIDTGVTASYGDRLLTLSTCDYQEKNGRFVVVCKRID